MPNLSLEQKIEAILLFRNEPVSYKELALTFEDNVGNIKGAVRDLQAHYKERGIVILDDGESAAFGTHPALSSLIEKMQKEEVSRELGRAGLETLSIILYKGPVGRREIDYIRGVNSSYIIRELMIRGLIDRGEPPATTSGAGRSFSYRPTLELLKHLGVTKREDLPEYGEALKKIESFVQTQTENADQ